MKKAPLLILFTLLIFSCSNSDDEAASNSIVGTWQAVSFTNFTDFDLNGDGTVSDNIYDEVDCTPPVIEFRADGTYSATVSQIDILDGDSVEVNCEDLTVSTGAYDFSENTLDFSSNLFGLGENDLPIGATLDGNTLTLNYDIDNDFVDLSITIVFRRQ